MTTPTNAVTIGTAGLTRTELLGLASTFAALAHRRRDDPAERAVASFLSRLSNELESAYDAAVQADDAIIDQLEAGLDDPAGDVWRFGDNLDHRQDTPGETPAPDREVD